VLLYVNFVIIDELGFKLDENLHYVISKELCWLILLWVYNNIWFYISLYAAGHFTFEASKVTKNACRSLRRLFTNPTLIKKTVALRLISFCLFFICLIEPFRGLFASDQLEELQILTQNHYV
jgi:hypothetical protein